MSFYENIEKYLDGELRGQELAEMKARIDADPDLREEVNFRKEINFALEEEEVMQLRDELEKITQSADQPSSDPAIVRWFYRRKYSVAAASIAVLLGIGGVGYYYLNLPGSTDQIFNDYYEPYEATITFRSADTEINTILTRAYQKYQNEEYSEALVLFNKVLDKRDDMAAHLYAGISYMEIEKYKEARHSLQTIIEDNNNLFLEQAKWYTAMCHIKIENLHEAKILLKELSEESRFYKKRARKAYEKLNKIKEDN